MMYRHEDLGDDQFEALIVLLCRNLLGVGVKGFAKGPDGGRDAKFVGTAQLFPSTAGPWVGTVIVQAKHTNGYNKSFSEAEFYSTKSENTVIGEEAPRVKKLREAGQLDHYMLFSNRRLAGNAEQAITTHLAEAAGLPESSIYLCGIEQLESWLKQFPDAAKLANLDPVDSPLIVSPDELAQVVEAFATHSALIEDTIDAPPEARTPYELKNVLNQMTPEYARLQRRRYEAHRAMVVAGEAADIEEDEESGATFDIGDYVFHAQQRARDMLNLHSQAFAVMLHHAWERHVCVIRGYPEYQCKKAYGELAKAGWPIDILCLERLRMTANCVKHDNGELFEHYPEMFDPDDLPVSLDGEKPTRHWQDSLRLSDEDISDFIDAVRRSAYKPVAHSLKGVTEPDPLGTG